MKMIEAFKEEMKNYLKEIKEMQIKIWKKSLHPLTKAKKQRNKHVKEMVQDL